MTVLHRRMPRGVIGAALASLAVACASISLDSGSHDNNGTGDPANWTITATASHTELTVQQGASDTETVAVTRGGGYTGTVTFGSNIPGITGGVTATLDNVATVNGVTTARIIIAIGSSFPITGSIPVLVSVFANPDGQLSPGQIDFHVTITSKPGVFVTAPSTLSVGQGNATVATVSLRRTQYTAAVPMSIVSTQAGITATFAPNPVTDTITQMTLSADVSVPTGTYSVGVRANNGDPVYQATAPMTLTVTPPGSFALTTNLPTLIVPKGSSVPTGVNIVRTNFTGPVTLAVTGLPTGLTATIANNPFAGNAGSISFTAAVGMASGSYPITITGTAVGVASASVPMTLSVP
ncbi:MAG: hypothetical protein ABUL71_02110 [Gemmatimonadota bacterium]